MAEVDVALTDLGIALECAVLTWLMYRGETSRPGLRRLFAVFFSSGGVAALAGGIVHGFFPDETSIGGAVLWRLTLLAIGISTLAVWSIGGRILLPDRKARIVRTLARAQCIAYSTIVLFIDQRFWIAIANYAPAIVFLGAAFWIAHGRAPDRHKLAGLFGVILTLFAAVVQRREIALDLVHLSHNAFYHLIQMAALGLLFVAGRHFIAASPAAKR